MTVDWNKVYHEKAANVESMCHDGEKDMLPSLGSVCFGTRTSHILAPNQSLRHVPALPGDPAEYTGHTHCIIRLEADKVRHILETKRQ